MKVKHLVTYIIIAANVLLTIIGLSNDWVEEKPTPLGLLFVVSVLVDGIVIVIIIVKNWDRKIF